MPHNQKGFTLIELMVVIIIIGPLAAIALPTVMVSQQMMQNASQNVVTSSMQGADSGFFTNVAESIRNTYSVTWVSRNGQMIPVLTLLPSPTPPPTPKQVVGMTGVTATTAGASSLSSISSPVIPSPVTEPPVVPRTTSPIGVLNGMQTQMQGAVNSQLGNAGTGGSGTRPNPAKTKNVPLTIILER